MKVILLQDVKSLGKKGDLVEVNAGYARNFILPKKLGIEATNKNINDLKLQKANEEKVAKEILEANSVPCEYDDTSITSIQSEKQGMKDGETYAWIFTLNGKEPQNTRSYNTTLSEGDVIVYYLTSIENDNPAGADTNS